MEKYCLFGNGIENSPSPYIHGLLFELRNRSAEYVCKDVTTADFDDELNRTLTDGETVGINATIPHKRALFNRLNGNSDESVRLYHSVNTSTLNPLFGYNTDVVGFKKSLELCGVSLTGRVAIFGAGSTGLMAGLATAECGGRLTYLYNEGHGIDKEAVTREIRKVYADYVVDFDTDDADIDFDVFINASPLGNSKHPFDCPVTERQIMHCNFVFDLNYYPQKSLLLRRSETCGVKAINGLTMLVYQAAASHKIWYGAEFSDEELNEVIAKTHEFLYGGTLKRNCITLCGFMGAGKSTLSEKLGKALCMPVVNVDKLIESRYGSISDIFKRSGEKAFRKIESDIIASFDKLENTIIDAGGGAILSKTNRNLLSSLGLSCFLDTPFYVIEKRLINGGRPIADALTHEELFALYRSRLTIYRSFADLALSDDAFVGILAKLSKAYEQLS